MARSFENRDWMVTHNYRNETLLDNWNEERFGVKERTKAITLPSDTSFGFQTTYQDSYNSKKATCEQAVPPTGRLLGAFPSHQLDVNQRSQFQSDYRTEYVDPRCRYKPMH